MPAPLTNVLQMAPTRAARKPRPLKRMPTEEELKAIPRAAAGEYELSDKEVKSLRSQIYSINKHNLAGFRFRTLRDGKLLMVWRIA